MKILALLGMSAEEREAKKAKLVGKALKRAQEKLVDGLEERQLKAQEKIDNLCNTTVAKINTETFAQEYHDAKLELELVTKEIEIANQTTKDLYTEVEE